ncbi:MAG: D-alanyl-D-alanine carboxypeptidase [Candidatus Obscuribacterales bacterium]|nr:D-alanyl-D-alanine carboxypeptidase [Candidatus Obscuribacterales bacterium]
MRYSFYSLLSLLILFLLGFPCATALSQQSEAPLYLEPLEHLANGWLKRPELQHSLIGLEIIHIPSGQVLFTFNGRRRFVPASTTKVFTTACAMDLLGADYRFKTRLKMSGKISGDKLVGSLFIEPAQDPTLTTGDLRQLLSILDAKGIKTIEGKIEIAPVLGGGDRFVTSWLLEDWGQDWMPCSSDLVVDDNLARRDPARGYPLLPFSNSPEQGAFIRSLLSAATGPSWICFNPANETMQYWHPVGAPVGGQIVGNPEQYNLAIVKAIVRSMKIKVKGHLGASDSRDEGLLLLSEHNSAPLSEIVRHCLKESDNLYAQQLLRTIGNLPAVNKSVEKATLEERGLGRLNSWLSTLAVPVGDAIFYDGCGLSRKNCFTPHAINLVHKYMMRTSPNHIYLNVMPLDGSPSAQVGSFRYKTGAMDSVRSISGVLTTAAGEPLAVTIMINAHTPSVRELRGSLGSLIDHLQSLGSLRLPAEKVPAKVTLEQQPHKNTSFKVKKRSKRPRRK